LRQTEGTQFFMRQDEVFSRRIRGGEQFREKRARHDFAENIPQICRRAVRCATPAESVGWPKRSVPTIRASRTADPSVCTVADITGPAVVSTRADDLNHANASHGLLLA
jgi:hypothetical protein